MRLHRVLCPKCHAALTSKAGIPEGQQLNCPKCKARFAAEPPAGADDVVDDAEVVEDDFEVVEDEPAPRAKKSPGRERARPARRDEDDEDVPRARKLARAADDDDDEEDDDRPRRRKKGRAAESTYRQLKGNVAVRVVILTVLLTVLGILGYLLYEKMKTDRENQAHNERMAKELEP